MAKTAKDGVNPYLHGLHLFSSLVLLSGTVFTAANLFQPHRIPANFNQIQRIVPNLRRFRHSLHAALAGVLFTAVSGSFMATSSAGKVYNTFPKFEDSWIPSDLISSNLSSARNWFENPTAVQFVHRIMGMTTLGITLALFVTKRRFMPSRRSRILLSAFTAAVGAQVVLGISTLLTSAHTHLAISHQVCMETALCIGLWLMNDLRWVKYIPK